MSGNIEQVLELNDIVLVHIDLVNETLNSDKSPWTLGYATTIHSSQGLTISYTNVWIVDDRIEWSNLVYIAVSRVQRINQLKKVVLDANDTKIQSTIGSEIISDDIIKGKLSGYKQQDEKNYNRKFDIDVELITMLKM